MKSILAVAVLAMSLVVTSGQVAAQDGNVDENIAATRDDQTRELLSEGVKLFRIGNFDEAALRMKDALLNNPSDKLIYEFYLAMGDGVLLDMQRKAELEDVLKEILRKARLYQTTLRRDPRYIDLLISKLRSGEKVRMAATTELVAIGPIAVPQLVEKLADSRQNDYRVWSRMVLTRMGYRAVVPLVEALNAEDVRQLESVVTILADLGDQRALPKLHEILANEKSTDTVKRTCRNTIAAIAARGGISQMPEGPYLYFQEALRYFRDGDQVRDELVANEALMWKWNEEAGENEFKLQYTVVPGYAWNELMAEELLYDGMAAAKEFEGYYPLLAAVLASQDMEAKQRRDIAKDRTIPPRTPDEAIDALEARIQALAETADLVTSFAGPHLLRAVQRSINDERYDTAIYLMNLLRDNWTARPEVYLPTKEEGLAAGKAGSVLVACLDHPEKRIRYSAAITLAHLDPQLEFFYAERVIPLLSDAVGEWGMVASLVVEPDYRHRNTARHQLMAQGLLAYTANDGFQAMQRLKESPFKDAVIIAGDLLPSLRDEHGVEIKVPEQTPQGIISLMKKNEQWAKIPVFIALPDNAELANKIQETYEKVEGVTGFVKRPYNGVEMKGKIEKAIGDAELPQVNRRQRENISLEACKALRSLNVVKTQFEYGLAVEALAGTIANRWDDIRIEALYALGQSQAKDKINYVTEVYESQAETLVGKPEVRAAFLYCIGLLDATTPAAQAIILEALKAEEVIVRRAAYGALGHDAAVSNDDRLKALFQQRINARAAGNGVSGN